MEGLVEQIKQLTSKQQLHTREIQWISQLYDHVQQNIGLDLLDPPPTAAQICFKIIDLIYQGYSAGFQAESNSKNFVLPVDALIVSIGEIKSHTTAYSSNLDNLWHDNFYSYLSPTVDRTISSQVDASLTSPNRSEWSQYSLIADHIPASQYPLSRVKQLPSKPYLLVARFARTHGPLGLPLLALQDNTGEIPFEWAGHVTPSQLNALSIITNWTYIPHYTLEDVGYIEIPAIDSCRAVWSVVPTVQIWPETLTADWHKHRAMSIEEFVVSRDKTLHLVGTVTAISPLILQTAHNAFYFAELSSVASDPGQTLSTLSTTVLIAGALTFTRRLLRVGHIYFITNLQLATLFPNSENERRTFTTSSKSRVHRIDSAERLNELWLTRERVNTRKRKSSQGADEEHDKKRVRADANVQDSSQHIESSGSPLPHPSPRVSYSGELTRYCGNCIYELDGQFKLYLTQYDLEDTLGRGLRVGALVTAHNIHPIRLHQDLHGFGCCVYSTVEVTAFSSTSTAFRPLVQSTNLYKPYWDALSFRDFALLHSTYEVLHHTFPEISKAELLGAQMKDIRSTDADQGVLVALLHTIGSVTFRQDMIYSQFFAHATHCNCSDAERALKGIALIAISDIVTRGQNLAVELRECDNWACSTLPSTEFEGHLVAKCALLDRKGIVSLHLLQREDAIPVVIEGDARLVSEYIDAVLLIRHFELVVENLRPPDATSQNSSHIAWLLVNTQHITIMHRTRHMEQAELVPALLESCTWPTRHEGQLRSQCAFLTSHHTRAVHCWTDTRAALARYMRPGMTLKVHLSRTDMFDCIDIKFVTCPHDIDQNCSVHEVLDVADPNNLAAEVAVLHGFVTHIQLLEDDNSPAVYSLDYRPQRKICEGKLVVKLQDIDGPDAVDVYIRLDVFVYPLGLVPGTQVTFYNVERKMSKTQSVYCTFNDESALVLHRWDKQKLCDTSNRSAALELFDTTSFKRTTSLIEFQDPNRIRRVFVRVCACLDKIISIKAEWFCNQCKRLSVNEMCVHGCKNQGFTFHCVLVATIDDGSNQIEALVKGDLVWQILNLNAEQTNGIMEQTMAMGPIKYTHGRYYCSDKLINAYHTRELQVLDDQINNDTIYRRWVFYGRQYYKTDGSEDDKSPMPRKVPYGLERVLMPHNTAPNDRSVQTPRNEGLAQCYFEVRHATCVVSVAEAYRLLQEMME